MFDCVCRAFEAPFFPPYSSCFSVMNWLPDKTQAEGGTHPLKESLAGLASTHALWLRHSNAITSALCALKQGYRGGQASFREDRAYRRLVPSIVSRGYKNARGGILFVARPPALGDCVHGELMYWLGWRALRIQKETQVAGRRNYHVRGKLLACWLNS